MVRIAVQRLTELVDGGKLVSHNVIVNLFPLYARCGLEMQCRNAQAAV